MFRERMLFVGGVILAMVCLSLFGFLMFWLMETFYVYEKINHLINNVPMWALLTIIALMFFYMLYRFIYWLLIQPYLHYRRNKNEQRKHA